MLFIRISIINNKIWVKSSINEILRYLLHQKSHFNFVMKDDEWMNIIKVDLWYDIIAHILYVAH